MIGLGAGLILGAALMMAAPRKAMTDGEIEAAARTMGMIYPSEITVSQRMEEGETP